MALLAMDLLIGSGIHPTSYSVEKELEVLSRELKTSFLSVLLTKDYLIHLSKLYFFSKND